MIRHARKDVFVVYAEEDFDIDAVKKIVVPLTGADHARAAGDFALTLASGLGASVRAVNVVRTAEQNGNDAANDLQTRAKVLEVACETVSRTDPIPGRGIIRELRAAGGDLCVLGTIDQSRHGRPFFGDTADMLLRAAPMPIGVLIVSGSSRDRGR